MVTTTNIIHLVLLFPCSCWSFVPQRPRAAPLHLNSFVEGPPIETKPDYENIHGPLGKTLDTAFLKLFRSKMAEAFEMDSQLPHDDYQGLMELTAAMNARYSDQTVAQRLAQDVLRKYFECDQICILL